LIIWRNSLRDKSLNSSKPKFLSKYSIMEYFAIIGEMGS